MSENSWISETTETARRAVDALIERAKENTDGGKAIDAHQVPSRAIAYADTQITAAKTLAETLGAGDAYHDSLIACGVADLLSGAAAELNGVLGAFGGEDEAAAVAQAAHTAIQHTGEQALRQLGQATADRLGRDLWPLDETMAQVRQSVGQFAKAEVEPKAEHIHRHDELVSDEMINAMAELGFFGLSVPEEYDGHDMGNLAMILTTEELSRASLAAAGSLITRPEILTKALVKGGTEAQKKKWLPLLASGEKMVAISVTEPNVGSDVASLACRAEPATDGRDGWIINGTKAWCTFAGRADIIALLARTNPDSSLGAKGLSLFIVEKSPEYGHTFEQKQDGGGVITGKADATPGYRGMHSYTLAFDNYFVSKDNLVGGEDGLGRGFYLQMAGFAAGRLQTGGRACGLAQAALDKTCQYVLDRSQFGKALIEYQLTQYELGRMAAKLAGSRAISYAAAEAMDEDPRGASLLAAQAKLLACDAAVWITQKGQLLHGGWGYAEEYAISRYAIDALVLPIFEGVKPVLELKVIARGLFSNK